MTLVSALSCFAARTGHADLDELRAFPAPEDSRGREGKSLRPAFLNDRNIENLRGLNAIAEKRGQTLAQMAIAWVLRGGRVTSALIGASRPEQVEDCVKALEKPDFTDAELAEIEVFAKGCRYQPLGCIC